MVSYAYDASSNRTQLSLNAVTSATYQYDVLNRLTQLTDAASLNTSFAYDVTDKLTSRTMPNGVVTTSQYDGINRLTRLTHAKSGNTLADFQYQFNAVSSITQMIDGAGTHNYAYDTRDRLTTATHPNQTNESYTLDDVGNRTASHQGSSYSYQAFNQQVTANSNTYAYNTNGNLISKTDASGSWSYTWDYENRLKQASKSGGVTVIYAYDVMGRRIQRTSSTGGTAKFVYDDADVVRDLDGNGATVADYLNGPGIDNKLRQATGGTASYFITDHLSTTRALTDASGNIASSLGYDSYGNLTSGSASTRYAYTGREIDSDVGLIYYRARWYDPQQGRFISEDPIGLEAGINFYRYVNNSPLVFADPLGLCPETKKRKCEQDKTGGDRADIELLLFRSGLTGLIENIRPSTINPEGIVYDITGRQAFLDTLKRNKAFKYDTPYNTEHTKDVGGSAIDIRSVTGQKGLGEDTHGVDRSLQVVVGPIDPASGGATGYADLDCDNPAQNPIKALKHGLPILGRRIRKILN